MIENQLRIGRFTSSNNYKLCASLKNGEPSEAFYTYIKEKMLENALCRSLDMGTYTQTMAWGKVLEKRVNDMLPLNYKLQHKTTFVHPKYSFWSGSPDFDIPEEKKIAELKCYEPRKFGCYVTSLMSNDTEIIKKDNPQEYWQIVSNCAIKGYTKGEAIVYMPYESEMDEIRELVQDSEYLSQIGVMPWEVRFIVEKPNSQLAVLPNGSKFKNINIFEFEIPTSDIIFLTKRYLKAIEIMNKK